MTSFSIHAHFYQPPREDPFTGLIPDEVSATPFANWNERIYAECYLPNTQLNNFERISYDIGPTLFSWIQARYPETTRRIVAQDRANVRRYGVGNAMAQAYNHTILPLGTAADKATQIYWGMADFEHYFGRKPQGMWLPETAVDTETLDVLARLGIEYTILAPWQAEGSVDTAQPYLVQLPQGRKITIFFYQGDLSGRISFDPDTTTDADRFAKTLLKPQFNPEKSRRGEAEIVLLASDGELYGHHQRLRDHFLARLVDGASREIGLTPTYPALFIQQHPARRAISIRENTSWSCHHGVYRWTGDCACTPRHPEWKQRLRKAIDGLAAEVDRLYLDELCGMFRDPWRLRHRYIHVRLGELSLLQLLAEETDKTLTTESIERIGLLLEAQRERQRMYTSCGWFFEDYDRIEPRNNLAYAAHAASLIKQAVGVDLAPDVQQALSQVFDPPTGIYASHWFEAALARSTSP